MSMWEDGLLIVVWKIGINVMKQNFKNYKAFDYSIKTRKKMNDVDMTYVPRFLLVSVISDDKIYEYVEKKRSCM